MMKKIWFIALICAALGTSACLITEGCAEIGCSSDLITIKLNGAEGAISGTVMVNGQPREIKTTGRIISKEACVERGSIMIGLDINDNTPISETTIAVELTATANGVTRSATQPVTLSDQTYYPNGEECPEECTDRRGAVTLQ